MAERVERCVPEPPPALDPTALAALVDLLVEVALAEQEQQPSVNNKKE
jgi:hypothetical protein